MIPNFIGSPYRGNESETGSTTLFNQSQFCFNNTEQITFPQCKRGKDHQKLEYLDKNFQPFCPICVSQMQQSSMESLQFYSLQQIILKTDIAVRSKNSKYEFQNTIISESKTKMESILKGLSLIQQKLDSPKYNLGFAIQKFEQDCLQPSKQIRSLQSLLKQISQQTSTDILELNLQKLKQQVIILSKDEVKLKKDESDQNRKELALKIENYIESLKESSLVLFKLVNLMENQSNIDPLMQQNKLSYEEQGELEEEIQQEMNELIESYRDGQIKQIINDKDQEIAHLKSKIQDFQANQVEISDKFAKSQQCVFELSNELEKVSSILKLAGELNQIKKPQDILKDQQILEQCEFLKDENIRLKQEIDHINSQSDERINDLQEQIDRLNNDVLQHEEVQQNYQNLQKQIEEQKYSYLIQENKYVEEINKLKSSVNQKEADLKSLKQINEDQFAKLQDLENKLRNSQVQVEELQNQLSNQYQSQSTKDNLKDTISKQDNKVKELESNLKKKEEQKTELELQVKDLNDKLNTQKQLLYKSQEQAKQSQEQSRIFQEKSQEANEENLKLKEIIKECKNQIQLDERNIYRLESEIKSLSNQLKQTYKLVNDQQLMQQSSRQSKIGFISMAGSRRGSNESKRGTGGMNSGKLNVLGNNSKK
ncbi:hypothetical protein TTHERM_00802500 (macronuclear) [Tetrahymena thermophila SB210]|uniref:Uncharacterized protein n=1 Tax=Tetrahymena thermophila (strain SB210) TaxID=312017 RepID=Q235F1_TETTS|nr:hypothetical protein TTHERM_00802500 [Tetrahymena thermophila SB210]EAR92152.2 hypothetical protein TTHERM_00802500 [Tetrahymena thermophila SB210]|eukprot:XP_001012397.2 hypothetical protein TTHERM_00802500 [Tetrahymena thermophila SB210]